MPDESVFEAAETNCKLPQRLESKDLGQNNKSFDLSGPVSAKHRVYISIIVIIAHEKDAATAQHKPKRQEHTEMGKMISK